MAMCTIRLVQRKDDGGEGPGGVSEEEQRDEENKGLKPGGPRTRRCPRVLPLGRQMTAPHWNFARSTTPICLAWAKFARKQTWSASRSSLPAPKNQRPTVLDAKTSQATDPPTNFQTRETRSSWSSPSIHPFSPRSRHPRHRSHLEQPA